MEFVKYVFKECLTIFILLCSLIFIVGFYVFMLATVIYPITLIADYSGLSKLAQAPIMFFIFILGAGFWMAVSKKLSGD